MGTTTFLCNDPDHSDGRRFGVPVIAGTPCIIDERVAKAYPATFTITTVEEILAGMEPIIPASDIEPDTVESLDVEPVSDDPAPDVYDPDPAIQEIDDEIVAEVIEAASEPEVEVALTASEPVSDVASLIDAIDDDEAKAHAEVALMNQIESFKTKKALDEWAAGLGVELDRRKKLNDMKVLAKAALDLG